ncbi:MAG: Coenzyme synthesis protein family protein [Chloroflexi bacterium]|nr:Coenzyme synthesis protein family protein [Chloroflexota bacterium]
MSVAAGAFVEELREIVNLKHTMRHPMVQRIATGDFSIPELRFFAQQYYQRTARMFPKLVAAVYSRTPDDPDLEHMLLENVVSESGFLNPDREHKKLFFQFGRALGLSREEIERARPVPELQAFIGWRDRVFYDAPWLEALTVQSFVFEGQNLKRAAVIAEGLRRHYSFSEEDIAFWAEHASEVEEEHADVGPRMLERFATEDLTKQRLREIVAEGVEVYWLVFDGIERGAATYRA